MPAKRFGFSTILLVVILCSLTAVFVTSRFTRVEFEVDDVAVSAHRAPSAPFPVPDAATIRRPQVEPHIDLPASPGPPRNVVLIIGDGMGLGHVSVVSTLLDGPEGGLALESAPVIGLVRTWAADDLVTGSAASASAISTGLKTDRKVVSMQPDGSKPPSLFEIAAARGLSTGMVTTSGIVDATPASFLAHAPSRYDYRHILEQVLASSADVVIGGDFTNHKRAKLRSDYLDLADSIETAAPGRWNVIRDESRLDGARAPLMGFFAPRVGHRYAHGPQLARSATLAFDVLALNPSGFLLVLECEEPDEGAHDNDLDRVVRGVEELDSAVAAVLVRAVERGDTLVLVTADHDTAVPAITDGTFDRAEASIRWLSDDHAATWVPLFAFGPDADRFAGVFDNTEIGRRIAEVLGLDGLPAASRDRRPG